MKINAKPHVVPIAKAVVKDYAAVIAQDPAMVTAHGHVLGAAAMIVAKGTVKVIVWVLVKQHVKEVVKILVVEAVPILVQEVQDNNNNFCNMKTFTHRTLFLILMILPFLKQVTAQNNKLIGIWKGNYINYFHGRADIEVKIDYIDSAWMVRVNKTDKYSSTPYTMECYDITQDDNKLEWFYKNRVIFDEETDASVYSKGWRVLDSKCLVRVEYKGGTLHYIEGEWRKFVTYGIDSEIISIDEGAQNPAYVNETILYRFEDK